MTLRTVTWRSDNAHLCLVYFEFSKVAIGLYGLLDDRYDGCFELSVNLPTYSRNPSRRPLHWPERGILTLKNLEDRVARSRKTLMKLLHLMIFWCLGSETAWNAVKWNNSIEVCSSINWAYLSIAYVLAFYMLKIYISLIYCIYTTWGEEKKH